VSRISPPPRRPSGILLTIVLFGAAALAAASYHSLLQDTIWWFIVSAGVAVVLTAMAVARRAFRRRWVSPLIGLAAVFVVLELFFVSGSTILGIIPTFDTLPALANLGQAGSNSIATQGIPAAPTAGIVFLLTAGFAVIAVLLDVLTFTVKRPSLTGIPLLLLIAVPSLIDTTVNEPFFFVATAAAYLILVFSASPRRQNGVATAVGASAIVGSLVVAALLPPVLPDDTANLRANGYSTGVNPFVNLGEDLRRNQPVTALTYTTSADEIDEYFTLTTLDNFTASEWKPTIPSDGDGDLTAIGPVPGRADGATVTNVETTIEVGNIRGRWLPVPYAPTSIEGLTGDWEYSARSLAISTSTSSMARQKYTVGSALATPSAQELNAASPVVSSSLEQYTETPDTLPAIIGDTATEVTADATTNFEKAMALQKYFRGGDFRYSMDAPVEDGYDGSSADVIATFLDVKAGYCVHFSAAMATMARTLDIPARIGVGFVSGTGKRNADTKLTEYTVTTDDLHAWPELYFDDIGWVRFEPTPGRGTVPDFGSALVDDPSTPDVNESTQTPPPPTAAPDETDAATPRPTEESSGSAPDAVITPSIRGLLVGIGIGVVILLVLLLPLFVRTGRRSRRFRSVRASGTALDAWSEVRDTATDLRIGASESETPRAFATRLSERMTPAGIDALARLLAGMESQAYADGTARVAVTAADLRAVVVALRDHATLPLRWRARFVPSSVIARFSRQTPAD
jgi:transglutaminase-like putative cysteine protease